jgi:hypothetical protein
VTCACGNRIPIAKKWYGPIYRDVSRMATQISDFDDPEPAFVASPAASTKADTGPAAVISNVGSLRRPGRRTGSVSWGRDGTPRQPFAGEGPARRRWQHTAQRSLRAILGNDVAIQASREGKLPYPDAPSLPGSPGVTTRWVLPVCRTSSRRSAPDQLDPALVEKLGPRN